jgi:hypothetical protein
MERLDGVFAWIATLTSLPGWAYWLAVALVALCAGVWLTHWQRRNEERAGEREDERRGAESTLALRREVYLPAAEAIARAQDFLGKYPGKDWAREEGSVVLDYLNGALGRVQVIGTERAIQASMAVATEFSISFLTLTGRRRPINEIDQEIEHIDSKVAHMSYERDQLLGRITRASSEGLEGQGIWNDLNLRFDKLHRQIAATLEERAQKVAERGRLKHELAVQAAQCSLKLAKLAVPAYLAIREELSMPIDEEAYRTLAHSNIGELEHAVRRLGTRQGPVAKPLPPADKVRAEAPTAGTSAEAAAARNLRMVRQSS